MRYCSKCLMPDTRPGLVFNEVGVCQACLWHEKKRQIDWETRERDLCDLVESAKSSTRSSWDCVVGVSGGKDSTWQAMYLKEKLGLNPLLVQFVGSDGTKTGRQNIENLIKKGFSHISIQPNANLARQLARKSFHKFGNIVKYSDYALFPIPFRVAMAYDIPLVFFGENPALEAGDRNSVGLGWDAINIKHNNTLDGSNLDVWKGEGIEERDLIQYSFPSEDEFKLWGGQGVFMGYFLNWSVYRNGIYAYQLGMEGIDADYRDIGIPYRHNCLDSNNGGIVNSMLKHIKLGFGNATEFLCYDVRDGRVTRQEAIKLVKELDGRCHQRYVEDFCNWIDITEKEFWETANSYRGNMWGKSGANNWRLKNPIWEQEPCADDISLDEIIERIDTKRIAEESAVLSIYEPYDKL
jgi:N-acetyl sugar amidotransferase